MEVKLEPDWCKNALNKKYKVCYETEKGLEQWVRARLVNYYWATSFYTMITKMKFITFHIQV